MLLGPSPKPLSRVLVLGEEASSLLVLSQLQNDCAQRRLAAPLDADALLSSPWRCWWSWFEGESQRFYCVAPRSDDGRLELLSSQRFSVLLWIIDSVSADRASERILLREVYLARPARVVVLLAKGSAEGEVMARELLQEANLPGDEAEMIWGGASQTTALLRALEGEILPQQEPICRAFYLPIERTIDKGLGCSWVFGYSVGGVVSVGDALDLYWNNRFTRARIEEIKICDLSQPQTMPGYPTELSLRTERGAGRAFWEYASAPQLLVSTKEITAEVYCYTTAQGGFRRSWSRGDSFELQLRWERREATISSGVLRSGELRSVTFSFLSRAYLFVGGRFFLASGGVVFGVGVIQKVL